MSTKTHCDLCDHVIEQGENVGQVIIKKSKKSNVNDVDLEIGEACYERLLGELATKEADESPPEMS